MPRCDACASWESWDNGVGRCHLMPPLGVRDARNEMWTPFPLVEPQWWCSQHQPRPEIPGLPSDLPGLPPPNDDLKVNTPAIAGPATSNTYGPPPVEDDF